jgi:hypothetical protein
VPENEKERFEMITYTHGKSSVDPSELYGLSTDTKPKDVVNASLFYEMDTKKIYLFDATSKVWLEQ